MTDANGPSTAVGLLELRNVRVFDGHQLGKPTTVVLDEATVSSAPSGDRVVDGGGGALLPGLIDAHVHLHELEDLDRFATHGVTTALDMASWPPSFVDSLRHRPGLCDIRSALGSCTVPGTLHSKMQGYPDDGILEGEGAGTRFVERRVAEGADYIKLIADVPGPDQSLLDEVVAAAHDHGKLAVTHASSLVAFTMAVRSGSDVITHVPLDAPIDDGVLDELLARGQVVVPTLCMMEGLVARLIELGIAPAPGSGATEGRAYANADESVRRLHAAGVPILAGTDANAAPSAPAKVLHGESLHHELELLVAAGLSTLDALRAATELPATHFGLSDRGRIAPGLRADLVLLRGDPIAEITATRAIERVWCGGTEYALR